MAPGTSSSVLRATAGGEPPRARASSLDQRLTNTPGPSPSPLAEGLTKPLARATRRDEQRRSTPKFTAQVYLQILAAAPIYLQLWSRGRPCVQGIHSVPFPTSKISNFKDQTPPARAASGRCRIGCGRAGGRASCGDLRKVSSIDETDPPSVCGANCHVGIESWLPVELSRHHRPSLVGFPILLAHVHHRHACRDSLQFRDHARWNT
jgi:hypothetical protein